MRWQRCILVTGDTATIGHQLTQVAFKNFAPFTKCVTNIDGAAIDDAEDLDLVMPMYNLIEYSLNYSETTGSLWFYSKDEATDYNNNIANTNDFKSFKHQAKLLGNTVADGMNGILKNAATAVPLKYFSNFCRSLEMLLISLKIELKLKWTKYCVLSAAAPDNSDANSNNIIFIINNTKLFQL